MAWFYGCVVRLLTRSKAASLKRINREYCSCLANRPLSLPLAECVLLPQQRTVKPWEGLRHLVKRGKEESASAPSQSNVTYNTQLPKKYFSITLNHVFFVQIACAQRQGFYLQTLLFPVTSQLHLTSFTHQASVG